MAMQLTETLDRAVLEQMIANSYSASGLVVEKVEYVIEEVPDKSPTVDPRDGITVKTLKQVIVHLKPPKRR